MTSPLNFEKFQKNSREFFYLPPIWFSKRIDLFTIVQRKEKKKNVERLDY